MSKIEAWAVVDKNQNRACTPLWYKDDAESSKNYLDRHRPDDAPHRIIRLVPVPEAGASEENEVERKAWEFYLASQATETGCADIGPPDAFRFAERFIQHRNTRRAQQKESE